MSDRRLRPWLLSHVTSGRFPGLQWDDPEQRALRIPWNRAGKGGAGGGAGAALCRAWAEFKGRVRPGAPPDWPGWKCRLRCALNRSPEFQELRGRGRSDGPRPYRVYRLLPPPARTRPPRARGAGPKEEEEGPEQEAGPGNEAPPPRAEQEAEPEPGDPGPAPPPPHLQLVIDSAEPLPPAEGGAALVLRLFRGGALCWSGRLPPGEFLLTGAPAPPPSPPPPLPRLLLRPLPPPLRGALGGGVWLGSAPRGLFLRRRGGRWGEGGDVGRDVGGDVGRDVGGDVGRDVGLHWWGAHGAGGALQGAQLVLAFDAQEFRRAVGQHRAGRGPRPQHHVTLAVGQELGPHDGPHNRPLVLQLEQAFARELLDGATEPHGCPMAAP